MILFADQYESHLLVLTVGVDIVINQNLRKIIFKSARSLTRIYKGSKLSDLFELISSFTSAWVQIVMLSKVSVYSSYIVYNIKTTFYLNIA